MTPEELLKPRVLVATDWPGRRDFEVGQIILLDKIFGDGSPMWEITDCQGTRTYIKKFFEMFPLQFKFLEWWEERDIKDMPGYIRFYEPLPQRFKIGKVSKWEVGNQRCIVTSDVDSVRRELSIADLPATESEYNEYIKSKL